MAGLHDDGDALGLKHVCDGVGNILGKALLDLQATGEYLGDSGELGKADNGVGGDVTDVHLEEKGQPAFSRTRLSRYVKKREPAFPVKGTR